MAKLTISVWHNLNGEIMAVGHPIGEAKCVPLSGENQYVLETEIGEEYITELPQTHIVDVSQKALIKRR